MATIANRSRYVVTVLNSKSLTKEFSSKKKKEAEAYLQELRAQGYSSARIDQGEDMLLVRFRETGFKTQTLIARSYEEAEQLVAKVEAEHQRGVDTDHAQSRRVTLAGLIDRYIEEVCPTHKGYQEEASTLNSFLVAAGYESAYARRREAEREAAGYKAKGWRSSRRRDNVEWILKPVGQIKPAEIQAYASAALRTGLKPATVDKHLDLFSQVFSWAMKSQQVPLERSPIYGVTRPRYKNERQVRLAPGQEELLLAAAQEEDRMLSREFALRRMLVSARKEAAVLGGSLSTRKRYIAAAREKLEAELGDNQPVFPVCEALFRFLLATACRLGEALALTWEHTDLAAQTAHFPETKNGTERTAPVRAHLAKLLDKLPRDRRRVFPLSVDDWKGAWTRIRNRAGMPGFRGHDLRHEAISRIADAGRLSGMPFDVVSLAAITGHRDLASLKRYVHMSPSLMARHLDQVFEIAARRQSGYRRPRGAARGGG